MRSLFAKRSQILNNMFDHNLLTFQAADPRCAAAHRDLVDFLGRTIYFVQLKRWALLRLARIAPPHPRRVSHHSAELLIDLLRRIGKKHRVAVAFAHFATVETRHLLSFGQQHFRLRKNWLIKLVESPYDFAGELDVWRLVYP